MPAGTFITFEGGEGAGKSTQVRLLADALMRHGIAVRATREPGGTPGGEDIRGLLVRGATERWDAMSEALLHFAARREHLRTVIRPQLAAGTWVVSDRFADSTMAYQGYGHELGRDSVEQLYTLVVGDFRPDLTIILDLPVATGLQRAAARRDSENRYEALDRAFHERVHAGFHDIAKREPDRCLVIDAAGDVAAVHKAVCAGIHARLDVTLS